MVCLILSPSQITLLFITLALATSEKTLPKGNANDAAVQKSSLADFVGDSEVKYLSEENNSITGHSRYLSELKNTLVENEQKALEGTQGSPKRASSVADPLQDLSVTKVFSTDPEGTPEASDAVDVGSTHAEAITANSLEETPDTTDEKNSNKGDTSSAVDRFTDKIVQENVIQPGSSYVTFEGNPYILGSLAVALMASLYILGNLVQNSSRSGYSTLPL